MFELLFPLGDGMAAVVTARRNGRGFRVEMNARPNELTTQYDRQYADAVRRYQADAKTTPLSQLTPPLDGAERFMSDVRLLTELGSHPPRELVHLVGGMGSEWTVVWMSSTWLPARIVLSSEAARLSVEIP